MENGGAVVALLSVRLYEKKPDSKKIFDGGLQGPSGVIEMY
jgi:hypothetical protein